ncbi:MAG: transglycosylase domain-containing protein, partial [Bdellovibrionales bacterium]|nr:transglycosylase domain-containing protein [Bdellovibrionales bacterium]
ESRNPAIEWDRFAKALMDLGIKMIKKHHHVEGGSTLATQMEKFRHSSEGRTGSPVEKLRQMASAALRAYQGGRDTTTVRKTIARDYINSVPLAAIRGFGEVQGLGEGLWAYFDEDVSVINQLLSSEIAAEGSEELLKQALAYRRILSIFLAHRRPSEFFGKNPKFLEDKINIYLPLVYREGLIPERLFKMAMNQQTPYRLSAGERPEASFVDRKAINYIRTSLFSQLRLDSLYTLDRTDLSVETTFHQPVQRKISEFVYSLRDKKFVQKEGLAGFRLLDTSDDLSKVIYSVTIYEKGEKQNYLRVQTDSNDQPFNINQGGRLDLGSTAKLRTLVSYLEIVQELFIKFQTLDKKALKAFQKSATDPISRWGIAAYQINPNVTEDEFLDLAMERMYSGDPGERFFTAGGMHKFHNFSAKNNGGAYSVAHSLRHSINLPFIRLMRDISRYLSVLESGVMPQDSLKLSEEEQIRYLKRFADDEGKQFVRNFWTKYRRKDRQELFREYLSKQTRKVEKLALAFWYLNPEVSVESLKEFLQAVPHFTLPSDKELVKIWDTMKGNDLSFADKAFLAKIHPLEMWVFAKMLSDPETRLRDLLEGGYQERQDSYEWLFKT